MPRRARVLRDQQAGDQPQALRRHLVQVTQRLLADHGLAGLTTRVIARAAQVSDGVLYNHFADKDELVVAALTEQLGEVVARHLGDVPEPGAQDLREGLTRLARLGLAFQSEALPLIGALLGRPELMHRLLRDLHSIEPGPQAISARVTDYLQGEQRLGTVDPDVDLGMVTQVLFGVQHLAALFGVLGGATPAPAETDRLVTFLLRACATVR